MGYCAGVIPSSFSSFLPARSPPPPSLSLYLDLLTITLNIDLTAFNSLPDLVSPFKTTNAWTEDF